MLVRERRRDSKSAIMQEAMARLPRPKQHKMSLRRSSEVVSPEVPARAELVDVPRMIPSTGSLMAPQRLTHAENGLLPAPNGSEAILEQAAVV
jgi:hypothetical protein